MKENSALILPKSNFPSQSLSVFNFCFFFGGYPLENLLFKENLHFPWEKIACVCSLLFTVELGGIEMLPHQS